MATEKTKCACGCGAEGDVMIAFLIYEKGNGSPRYGGKGPSYKSIKIAKGCLLPNKRKEPKQAVLRAIRSVLKPAARVSVEPSPPFPKE